MNKSIKLITGLAILILALLVPNIVFGASANISAGSTTIEKGKSTNISVSISATETWNLKITSSGGSLSGTTDSTDASDGETSKQVINATFSANSAGTYTISLTGQIAGSDLVKQSVSKSVTITVKEPEVVTPPPQNNEQAGSSAGGSNNTSSSSGSTTNKKPTTTTKPTNQNKETTTKEEELSNDSLLATLAVAEGVLSPEFNKDIKEYTLSVPNEITTVNIAATTSDKKAGYTVSGNTELKEGENIVTITVKAEDGSSTDYIIKVTRARPELVLQTLIVKYVNQNGELIEIPLDTTFSFDKYEYTLEDLEYWVEKLDIEAIANIEGAIIEIQGNEYLKTGENIITITAKIPLTIEGDIATGEETTESEETKTYTIKVNKKEEPVPPTLMGRISNWFNGMLAGLSDWYAQNQTQVIMGALGLCIVALIGLSIYIIVDYKKYKVLLDKLKKVNELNNAQTVENIETQNIGEAQQENIEIENDKDNKPKGGKHF